jgi:hypothetical protein
VKGPPIRVVCECGERALVPYPNTWVCESCGRRWNTGQIPSEDYWGIMSEMRRFRLEILGIGAVLAVGLLGLAIFVNFSLLFLLPVFFGGWYLVYMPRWRRRVRARTRALPNWTLRPE